MPNQVIVQQKLALLDNILAYFEKRGFSKNEAADIVGGRKRLMMLIEMGEVDVRTNEKIPHGKWQCRGESVLRHLKRLP